MVENKKEEVVVSKEIKEARAKLKLKRDIRKVKSYFLRSVNRSGKLSTYFLEQFFKLSDDILLNRSSMITKEQKEKLVSVYGVGKKYETALKERIIYGSSEIYTPLLDCENMLSSRKEIMELFDRW